MIVQRITNSAGVDDIKLIAETEDDKILIRQLAESGTLISRSSMASSSIVFRALSASEQTLSTNQILSRGTIGKVDFKVRQNQTFRFDLRFNTADGALNLTDYTSIKMQFKVRKDAGEIVSLSIGSGLTITGEDNNVLSVELKASQTALFCNDEYYHDIVMETPSAKVYYIEGKVFVEKTTTR